MTLLILCLGISHAYDLSKDQQGLGVEDSVTIDIYSDPGDLGLVCVAIEDWSAGLFGAAEDCYPDGDGDAVPDGCDLSELFCYDEDGLEFFGEVDLAAMEWVGSAVATHAYSPSRPASPTSHQAAAGGAPTADEGPRRFPDPLRGVE